MRLIDADKIHPDVRTQRGGLAISQGQLAYAEKVNAILIPEDATNGDVIKAMFPQYYQNILSYLDNTRWWDSPYKKEGDEE